MSTDMGDFLQGASAMGCSICGLYFLRFWKESMDRLFLFFAIAFWLLALNYALLGTIEFANESRVYVFVVRLLAFSLIVYGIVDKNRG
jgi:hypothetical protein